MDIELEKLDKQLLHESLAHINFAKARLDELYAEHRRRQIIVLASLFRRIATDAEQKTSPREYIMETYGRYSEPKPAVCEQVVEQIFGDFPQSESMRSQIASEALRRVVAGDEYCAVLFADMKIGRRGRTDAMYFWLWPDSRGDGIEG